MTEITEPGFSLSDSSSERLSKATDWFMRLRSEDADVDDLAQFQRRLEEDADNARAYREVCASWTAIGEHASAPEIMTGRRDALEDARQGARERWRPKTLFFLLSRVRAKESGRFAWAASIAGIAFALVTALWLQTRPDVYSTGVGERRTLTMADGSVVTLDARTRIHVKYRDKERLIALEQGQARFDVAKDPSRPFRVKASNETVVALGTQFNVEIVDQNVLVTMIEGHVAIVPDTRPPATVARIELTAGEALHVRQDGKAIRLSKVNVERVTAWQSGKMFFDNEPLASAAERINRYAREQIRVDPSAAQVGISGVFNAGDANAFIEAVTSYFPVKAARSNGSTLLLSARDTVKGQALSSNP
jgi:transmembrane sensor